MEGVEAGLGIFVDAFVKSLCMLRGARPRDAFTEEGYAKFYQCVCDFSRTDSPLEWELKLCDTCVMAWRESIKILVVPSIKEKKDDYLLVEVLHMWAKCRATAKFFSRFLAQLRLPDHIPPDIPAPVAEVRLQFHRLVCGQFFDKCCDAVISLINNERDRTFTIGRTILKVFVAFCVEMGGEDTAPYYDLFEQVLLDDAAKYYSQIASELLQCDSGAYLPKVKKLLATEGKRGAGYLKEAALEKLKKVVVKHLVDEGTAREIFQTEKSKGRDTTKLKEFLSEICNISLSDEDMASKVQDHKDEDTASKEKYVTHIGGVGN